MEWVATLGTSILTLVFALVIIILLIIMVKRGEFKFQGKGFTIGGNEDERSILRKQIEYTGAYLDQFITHPMLAECDQTKVKYITGKVKDVIESAILYNHLTTQGSYIDIKTELIMATIRKRTDKPLVLEDEFKKIVAECTKNLFEQLIAIREVESK